jgi:predicted PurR-regulated permease PerM
MSSAIDTNERSAGGADLQPRERVIGAGIEWTARWSLRWVFIALGIVLLGFVVRETWTIVLPILLALLITSVLAPLSKVYRERLRLSPGLAAAATLLSALLVVLAIGFAIAPSVAGQTDEIVSDTTGGLQRLQDYVQSSDFVSKEQVDSGLEGLQDQVKDSAGGIASGVLVGVSAVGSATITLVVSLILVFLFLKDGRRFVPWLRGVAGSTVGPHLDEVLTRVWNTLGGFIRTQALVSLIDAVFIGAALLIVGVPLAVPLAILTFFGGFVPIVGAFVVGAVAVLVALVSNGLTGALIILAVILVVQQLEGNVLSPWLQSQSMNLHAAVVLLSVTLGSTLFGIIGAFLAVPVVAVAAVVLRYLNDIVASRSMDPGPGLTAEAGGDGDEGSKGSESSAPGLPPGRAPSERSSDRD